MPALGLTIDQARRIVAATLAHGKANDMAPLCVAVLDAGGHLTAFEREDGVPNKRFEIAYGKAFGAISMGFGSRTLGTLAVERPHFIAGAGNAIGGPLVPVPGGVIVVDADGNRLGAVGVSGDSSDNDEAAALAGIEAAGLSGLV